MTRAFELVRDIRIQVMHLAVLNAGLERVNDAFENDGEPDVLCVVDTQLKDRLFDHVSELTELFAKAESIGLMNALTEASLKIGMENI